MSSVAQPRAAEPRSSSGCSPALGFASVYIARAGRRLDRRRSRTPLFFLALYLAAHVVARLTVPYADPYLLPMAGLLTAIGLTEIYRLNPSDAFRQGLWIVIGVGALRGDAAAAAPRLPQARALQVPVRPRRDRRCSLLPALPGARADRSTAPGSGCTSARSSSSRASSRRSC